MPKMKMTIQTVMQKVQKSASGIIWGCVSAHGMGDLLLCEGAIDGGVCRDFIEIMLSSRQRLFLRSPG